MAQIKCPHCHTQYQIDNNDLGRQATCTICGNVFVMMETVGRSTPVPQQSYSANPDVENEIISGRPAWRYYIFDIIISLWLIPFFGIGILLLLITIWRRCASKYVLTTKKLKIINGIIIKNEITIRIEDIRAISIKRNLWDVIFCTATLVIGTSALQSAECFIKHIGDYKFMQIKIDELTRR